MTKFIDLFKFIKNSRPWHVNRIIKENTQDLNKIFKINSGILKVRFYVLPFLALNVVFSVMIKAKYDTFIKILVAASSVILFGCLFYSFKLMVSLVSELMSKEKLDKKYLLSVIEYQKLIYSAIYVSLATILFCVVKVYLGIYLNFGNVDIFTVGGLITAMLYFVKIDATFESFCANYYTEDYIKYKKIVDRSFTV